MQETWQEIWERYDKGMSGASKGQYMRWAGTPPEVRQAVSEKIGKAQRAYRDRLSPPDREGLSQSISKGVARMWAKRSPRERLEVRQRMREGWAGRSSVDKLEHSKHCSERMAGMTVIEREAWLKSIDWYSTLTPEQKEQFGQKRRDIASKWWAGLSLEEREAHRRLCQESLKFRGKPSLPNREEFILAGILQRNFQDTWPYTGNFKFCVGGRWPDFKHVLKDWVIEYFGDERYHGEDGLYGRTEKGTIEHYEKLGYRCLVIWWYDLWEENVVKMVADFIGEVG